MSTDPDLFDAAEMTSGKLMATRLALWDAIGRLDEIARIDMRDEFAETPDQVDTVWPGPLTAHQTEVVDELELIAHQLRYHPARTPGDEPPSGDYATVCMRCDSFPIPSGQPCPSCGTRQFLSRLRI